MNTLPTYWIYFFFKTEIEIFRLTILPLEKIVHSKLCFYWNMCMCCFFPHFIAYCIFCIVLIIYFHCWCNIWSDRIYLKAENLHTYLPKENNAKYKFYTIDKRKFENFLYNCEEKKQKHVLIKHIFVIILIRKIINLLIDCKTLCMLLIFR